MIKNLILVCRLKIFKFNNNKIKIIYCKKN